jgi:ribonuclease P protein component
MTSSAALHRLTKRTQFLFVRQGLRANRKTLAVEARRRAAAGSIGIGFTASRAVGGAVQRNRARRRLREAARQLLPGLGVPGVDYVIVARQSASQAPWPALLDDLRNALIRLRAELEAGDRSARARGSARKPSESD